MLSHPARASRHKGDGSISQGEREPIREGALIMARISGVTEQDAQGDVRQALSYVRSGFAQMTGRETDRMIEPLELYARQPGLLRAVGSLAQASGELRHLPERIQALVGLKAATLTHCEYCIDL